MKTRINPCIFETHDVKVIIEEVFVVRANIEGDTESLGRVDPTDQAAEKHFKRVNCDRYKSLTCIWWI